jgi:hypothetical protein
MIPVLYNRENHPSTQELRRHAFSHLCEINWIVHVKAVFEDPAELICGTIGREKKSMTRHERDKYITLKISVIGTYLLKTRTFSKEHCLE